MSDGRLPASSLASADTFGIRRFYLFSTDAGKAMYVTEGFVSTDRYMLLTVPI